jgi:nitric oxide reductase NorQ protein
LAKQQNPETNNSQQVFGSDDTNKINQIISSRKKNGRITVHLHKKRIRNYPPHYHKYEIQDFDLHPNYWFDDVDHLIPHGVDEYVDDGEQYVERIVRALYFFKQCALIGPSGTGKTHVVYLIAELTGLPIWEINCALQTTSYDLIGRYIGLGRENWIDGPVTLWLRHGGLLYIDEANMMRQDVASRLNPVLDARGQLVLSEKDNEIVPRHKYSYCIISINPLKTEYLGVKRLNAAFRRRMSVWINFKYLSIGQEISMREVELIMRRSKIDENTANKILRVGSEIRRQYQAGDLPYGPSPRDLINWAILSKNGVEPKLAAEETIIALTSDDQYVQEEVRKIVSDIFT